jgi:hypothetical protein
MVGIGRADRERNGAAEELPAIGRHPRRALVARPVQPAPSARIVALRRAHQQD